MSNDKAKAKEQVFVKRFPAVQPLAKPQETATNEQKGKPNEHPQRR